MLPASFVNILKSNSNGHHKKISTLITQVEAFMGVGSSNYMEPEAGKIKNMYGIMDKTYALIA